MGTCYCFGKRCGHCPKVISCTPGKINDGRAAEAVDEKCPRRPFQFISVINAKEEDGVNKETEVESQN